MLDSTICQGWTFTDCWEYCQQRLCWGAEGIRELKWCLVGRFFCGRVGTNSVWLWNSAIDHKCGHDIFMHDNNFIKISFQNADEVIICHRILLMYSRLRNIFMDVNPWPWFRGQAQLKATIIVVADTGKDHWWKPIVYKFCTHKPWPTYGIR